MSTRPIIIIGEPGSGKTSFLHYLLVKRVHHRRYEKVVLVSNVDGRDDPLGVETARTLEEAVLRCKGASPAVVGYDEINQEVDRYKVSPALEAVVRYRRHMDIELVATTQRPHDLPPRIRDLDVHWRLMRWSDKGAYAWGWIAKRFPRQARKLAELEPYWFEVAGRAPRAGRHYVIGR